MAKINVSDAKKKALAKAILNSNFRITVVAEDVGCWDLSPGEYIRFVDAITSGNPAWQLQVLYMESQVGH